MTVLKPEVRMYKSPDELAAAAAGEFFDRAGKAIEGHGRFNVVLSGGNTPLCLYGLLALRAAVEAISWDRVHFFWGDERDVPPDDPRSNYRAAREALLSRLSIAAGNIHRIPAGVGAPEESARDYEQEIRRFFALRPEAVPRFDLVFLGLGADGHTASLFPDSAAIQERRHLVVANYVEKLASWRITLTAPVFNRAACVIFLVEGAEKADALRRVLEGGGDPAQPPARLIHPEQGELLWFVDRKAARLLNEEWRVRSGPEG
jgi:6-phosphogluconolactonase